MYHRSQMGSISEYTGPLPQHDPTKHFGGSCSQLFPKSVWERCASMETADELH